MEAAYKHNYQEVVIHSLSNNGAILYQHLTQLVATQYQDIIIKVKLMVFMISFSINHFREQCLTLPPAQAPTWSTFHSQ